MARDRSEWFREATATRAEELYREWCNGNTNRAVVLLLEMREGIGEGFAAATLARFVAKLARKGHGADEINAFCKIVETETNGT